MESTAWQDFLQRQEAAKLSATPSQLAALKLMFSDPGAPLSEIANFLTADSLRLFQMRPGASDIGLWSTLSEGIRELTEYNDTFVELFNEIAEIEIFGTTDLALGNYWEWWDEIAWQSEDPPETDPNKEATQQGWFNINAWCVKVSRYREKHPALDNLRRVNWVRQILEVRPEDVPCKEISAAAVWLIVDAQAIYALDEEFTTEYETEWKGKTGFSTERFQFWRRRFEVLSRVETLDERSRTDSKKAAAAMMKAELGNIEE